MGWGQGPGCPLSWPQRHCPWRQSRRRHGCLRRRRRSGRARMAAARRRLPPAPRWRASATARPRCRSECSRGTAPARRPPAGGTARRATSAAVAVTSRPAASRSRTQSNQPAAISPRAPRHTSSAGRYTRSVTRQTCRVPPPPSPASSATLSRVQGSAGFHCRSTTCGVGGRGVGAGGWRGWGGSGGWGTGCSAGRLTLAQPSAHAHGAAAGQRGTATRCTARVRWLTAARCPACWNSSCWGVALRGRLGAGGASSAGCASRSHTHTSLQGREQGPRAGSTPEQQRHAGLPSWVVSTRAQVCSATTD